jgi:hypothetical protein
VPAGARANSDRVGTMVVSRLRERPALLSKPVNPD